MTAAVAALVNTMAGGIRRRRLRWPAGAPALLAPALLLLAWAGVAGQQLISPQILPTPRLVGETIADLIRSGDLLDHTLVSLGRVLAGLALGGVPGVALGLAMGLSRRVDDHLRPLWKGFTQVPLLGWIPLLMMVVGIDETLKVLLLTTAALVPVALNTAAGIRNVPAPYLEVARALRFNRRQLLRKVVLPAAVPAIFTGLRQGLTQVWLALVTVELLASSEGLGFLIVWGRQLFQLDLVLAAVVIVGLVGLALDRALALAEARLLPWRRELAGRGGR